MEDDDVIWRVSWLLSGDDVINSCCLLKDKNKGVFVTAPSSGENHEINGF